MLSNMSVNQALSQYINQCNKGEHVVLKSYSSFAKSIVNRQCFLYNFSKIFETQTNSRNGLDYYQLFRLLCSDFPKQVIVGSVRLLQGSHEKMMEGLLDSNKFMHSLYIHFIYSEYIESLLQKVFKGNHDVSVPLAQLYEWMWEEDQKNIKINEKPNISVIFQIVLNFLSKRNLLKTKGLIFLNENTVDSFIRTALVEKQDESKLTFDQFTLALLENKNHIKTVDNNLNCFDNSNSWASEAAKLLMMKDADPQPLNQKKIKKK